MSEAPAAPSSRAAAPSLIRRLLSAQESGLVLVIALMMTGLTIYGAIHPKEVVRLDPQTKQVVRDPDTGRPVRDTTNAFLEPQNLLIVTTYASFIAVMAVGMTGVIILGGIDLSVGSTYAFASYCGAVVLVKLGVESPGLASVPLGILACCTIGALAGLVNGALTVGLRVHSFIITLGTMVILRGLVAVLSNGASIPGFPASFTSGFFKVQIGGISPTLTLIMVLVAGVGTFLLIYTVIGRRIFATGGNETAALYAGVPVGRVKIVAFTLCGLLAGLAGSMYIGYFGAWEPSAGTGYELKVIAATVIGGASLAGGRGSAAGAVLGAIVIQLIDDGMVILGINQSYNNIVLGTAIIVAVVIDQTKLRLQSGRA
ncbi:MAG: ABC transporter permease [Phycisphaerales bacterium]|nr:ABC transporter permease [Phycisphaerales bacterium]